MCLGIFPGPVVIQPTPIPAGNIQSCRIQKDLKSDRQQDNVSFVKRSVRRSDAVPFNALDTLGYQGAIGFAQRLVPTIVQQDAFGIGWVIRKALGKSPCWAAT